MIVTITILATKTTITKSNIVERHKKLLVLVLRVLSYGINYIQTCRHAERFISLKVIIKDCSYKDMNSWIIINHQFSVSDVFVSMCIVLLMYLYICALYYLLVDVCLCIL